MLAAVDFFEQAAVFGDWLERVWPLFLIVTALVTTGRRVTRKILENQDLMMESKLDAKLAPIAAELTTNGGGTLKDAVNRIEANARETVRSHDGFNASFQQLEGKVDEAISATSLNGSRLAAVVSSLESPYYEMNAEGAVIYVNDAYLKLFGLTMDQALHSVKWRDFISDEDLAQIDLSGSLAQRNHSEWLCEFDVSGPSGTVHVTSRAKPLFSNKEFIGFSGVLTI